MQKVYVIVGPTGVGKTQFSIRLAKAVNGEIINGDAFQVYKDLNIGTAKITKAQMQGVKHHLLSFLNFDETFNVFLFQQLGRAKIAEIISRNKVPIIVGGSGYYLKTLLYDYQFSDEKVVDLRMYSNEELMAKLKDQDAALAKTIHVNNRKRLERAIITSANRKPIGTLLYDATIIGITMARADLYNNINKRVLAMIEAGLVDEVAMLLAKGATFEMQSLQAIGYQEFKQYFADEITLDECIKLIQRNTRRYAKKQYTWFNNQMPVQWINKSAEEFTQFFAQFK